MDVVLDHTSPLCIPLLLCYVSLFCYVVFLGCHLKGKGERKAAWKAASRLLTACRPSNPGEWNRSLDLKVRESVERERVRCVRKYANPLVHLTALYILGCGLLQLVVGRCTPIVQDGQMSFRAAEEIQAVAWFMVCLVFALVPRLVTTRAIEFAYMAFTVFWICRIALVSHEAVPLAVFKGSLLRAIMGILVCNAGVTSVCNIVVMVAHCIVLKTCTDVKIGTREESLAFYIAEEIYTSLFIVCMLFFFEGRVWAVSRHTLQIKASSQAEVTVRRLLSALCDAVVTLGPDLRISARAPKLANLLLQGRSTTALEGVLFLDFMACSDQDRFKQFLARAPDHADSRLDPEPAQALNVHLRDSSGITVQVQLFHSHFMDLSDKIGHLIGICEVGDTGGRRIEGNHTLEFNQNLPLDSAQVTNTAVDSVGELSDSETSFFGESASVICSRPLPDVIAPRIGGSPVPPSMGSRGPSRVPQREVSLAFDELHFKVMDRTSPAAVIDASLMDKESLQQWVAEWSSCKHWMQDFVNAVLRPVNAGTWPARAGPPTSLSFQVSFRGTCALPPDILSRPASRSEGRIGPPTRFTVNRVRLSRHRRGHIRESRGEQMGSGREHSGETRLIREMREQMGGAWDHSGEAGPLTSVGSVVSNSSSSLSMSGFEAASIRRHLSGPSLARMELSTQLVQAVTILGARTMGDSTESIGSFTSLVTGTPRASAEANSGEFPKACSRNFMQL